MKLFAALLLPLVTVGVFSSNVDTKSFQDDQRKVSRQYNLFSIIEDAYRNSHHSSSLNSAIADYFLPTHFDEFGLDENENPFVNFFADRNASSKCKQDLLYTLENLGNLTNPWALKLLDSYGKLESGIAEGNFKWLGNYLECLNVHAPSKANSSAGNFNGKYCSLSWDLQPMENVSIPFTTGVCIPDSCTSAELTVDFLKLLKMAKSIPIFNSTTSFLNITSLSCKEKSKTLNAPAIGVICLVSFFVLLAVLGSSVTAFEHYFDETNPTDKPSICERTEKNSSIIINEEPTFENHNSDAELLCRDDSNKSSYSDLFEKCKPFLKCFCLFTNGSKLLNTDQAEGQLLCIHGIRFLSMTWVILGHVYAFSFSNIPNIFQAAEETDNFPFQIMYQAFFSVDSFFVLSGFLLTYLFMQECSKNKENISWPYFYIHRYLRLTPVYMIILGIATTVYFYLGSGPNWPDNDIDPVCKDYWWTNFLYINNFSSLKNQCFGHSWYLANDMQFFIISPLFLITLFRWPKIGYSLLGVFLFASCCANFLITYYYNLFAGVTDIAASRGANLLASILPWEDFFTKLYIKPYTRIGPYLIGILAGYLLFKAKTDNWPKMNRFSLLGGWIVAASVTLATVYSLYHKHLSTLAASFYNSVSRSIWGAGLSWVIYVCLTGQGGAVNKILSFKLFIPLSRLTYSAYLIHPLFITGYFTSMKSALTFSHPTMVLLFLGILSVTYAFALLVSLIFESPIIGLEKLIRNKFKSK